MLGSVGLNSVLQCLDSLEKEGGEKGRKEQRRGRKGKEGKMEEKKRKEERGIFNLGRPMPACLPSFLTSVMYDHEPAGRMGTRREGGRGRDFIFKVCGVPSFVHATQCHCYLEFFTPY